MKKILIADKIVLKPFESLQKKFFYVIYKPGISNEDILRNYNDCDILIIRSVRKLNSTFLNNCGIKTIATVSRGTDHIDVSTASKNKIKILHCRNGNADSAAEMTLALILSLSKNIIHSDSITKKNNFLNYDFFRCELKNKTIGIIGFGEIGSRVGKLCKSFGMKILVHDINKKLKSKYKSFKFVNLYFLLSHSDYITLHIPAENNLNFFDESKMRHLKKNVVLVNTSRGEVIDESSLIKNLKSGKIFSAALDVFKNEPNINKEFLKLKNVILTNHIAGKTPESALKMSIEIADSIKKQFTP